MSWKNLQPFGLEVTSADLARLTKTEISQLATEISKRGFAVFRAQQISDHDFVGFLQRLGPMTFTKGELPVTSCSKLNVVTNVGRTDPPRSVFHTDTSYIACPPAYTALRITETPKRGGDTLITNQYQAYDTLPKKTIAELADAQVLHVATGVALDEDDESQHWHPLFRRHPITGKKALFLSTPTRCVEIFGFDRQESETIIKQLYQHSTRPLNTYRHRWSAGDVLIWDNRCTMHRADHSAVVGRRTLHRGLVSEQVSAKSQITKQPLTTTQLQ
ncbi:MAG: TauD/TfdA family dioxygenase [Pseudomonadota bacterium]